MGIPVFLPTRPDGLCPQDGPCDHRDGEDASGCRVAVPEFRSERSPAGSGLRSGAPSTASASLFFSPRSAICGRFRLRPSTWMPCV